MRPTTGTFLVEVTEETWQRAGYERMDERETIAACERVRRRPRQASDRPLQPLAWRRFPAVWNRRWSAGNVVLIGDALQVAATSRSARAPRLAMEDAGGAREGVRRAA
ncbi:MAG: hypothetical protein U1F67_10835 [Rubrivivax sp.]